jgi:uncharacterized membrane protein
MRLSIVKIVGIVLAVAGLIVLILGVVDLVNFNSSTGGKIANSIAGAFGTRTETVKNCIIQICIGAGCAVVGLFLYRKS